MKTSIKSLIALAITAIVLTGSTVSSFAGDGKKETLLAEVKKVNSINVSGNVELILVQSSAESVKVYDDYYAKNALVQQKDGELRISSYSKEMLTVVVYVTNLSSLVASDRATVRTVGKLSVPALDINLKNQATANLNTNSVSLVSHVTDGSTLTLTGSTESYNSFLSQFAKVNTSEFTSAETLIQSKNLMMAKTTTTHQVTDLE